MDRKLVNIIIIAACMLATVLGIMYQVIHLKEGRSLADYWNGGAYENSSEYTVYE